MSAATVGVAGLAGCSAVTDAIPFVGGSYTDWVFEPGAVGDDDHQIVSFTDYRTIVDNEDAFDSDYYDESFESNEDSFPLETVDLDVEDVQSRVTIGGFGGRIAAEYEREAVATELEDEDYDDDTEYEGYTVYLGPNERRAVGIDGSNVLYSRTTFTSDADPVEIVEALIDAKNGEEDRYVDESEGFKGVSDELGSPTFAFLRTQDPPEETNAENGRFEENVAGGFGATVNGETTNLGTVLVFDSEDDVDMDGVEEYADTEQFDEWDDLSTTQAGTAVLIEGQVDTDDLQDVLN